MLIKKIALSNFKNFENVEVELGQINIIVGANASGKSNFLQSIKFISDIEKYGLENAVSLQGGIEYLRNIKLKEKKNIRICLNISPPGGNVLNKLSDNNFLGLKINNLEYSLEIAVKSKNKFDIVKEEIKYNTQVVGVSPDTDLEIVYDEHFFSISSIKGKLSHESKIKKGTTEIILQNGEKCELNNDRINPFLVPFNFFKSEYDKKLTLIEQFSFLIPRSIEDFKIYDFDLKNSKKPASITSKAQLEENGENLAIVLKNILNDKEEKRKFANLLSDILPFIKTLDTEKSQDNSLFFRVTEIFNSDTAIPSSLLSDGTISVTSIVTALFFQDSQFAAFEEPEHGIHPALISKLMNLFYDSSRKKQIIITTHSPEILKYTKLDDLFLVSRDSNGLTVINKPGHQEMVKAFLKNELGIDHLFVQNLLDI